MRPDLYDGARAGATSQVGRGKVYALQTFLGDYEFVLEHSEFHMSTTGDALGFLGREWHTVGGVAVYKFSFHGGEIT